MDGNGRWAQKRGLPRVFGHKKGVETVRLILKECARLKVKYLTLYTFSTENWRRPKKEVDFLMKLLGESIANEVKELNENGVKILFLGNREMLNKSLIAKIEEAENITKKNSKIALNIMLNYGGRTEILEAVKNIIKDKVSDINELKFSNYLYTKNIPDPDLLIRTAGEQRISNFLLWQIAYTELYFTSKLWPDFSEEDLQNAIADYKKRTRKYGDVK